MYYALIVFSTVLFSLGFFAQQGFQGLNGTGIGPSLKYALQTGAVSFCIMFALTGFQLQFSWFSLAMAVLNSAVCITSSYCAIVAFNTANLSVYSVFTMLGGMLLPSVYGILFLDESVTAGKLICCALIVVALLFSIEGKSGNKKAYKYYFACFTLNGLTAVLATIHQSGSHSVDGQSYIAMSNLVTVAFCAVFLLFTSRNMLRLRMKDLLFTAGGAVSNGGGNLLLLIALKHVDASVQYPLVTGGVIIFSAVITLITAKRLTRKNVIAVIVAFLASVFVIL